MVHSSGRRAAVLEVLREAGRPMAIAEVADRLGVHVNTVRFHLGSLAESGQVERVPARTRAVGRPPLMFRAVSRMDPAGPTRYRMLAEVLAASVRGPRSASARMDAASRAWGRRLASEYGDTAGGDDVDRLVALLDDLSFAPARDAGSDAAGEATIALHHCPFLELAESRADVVCPIHLGLMRGAVEEWEAPVRVERLEPFVEPDTCVAHLARR